MTSIIPNGAKTVDLERVTSWFQIRAGSRKSQFQKTKVDHPKLTEPVERKCSEERFREKLFHNVPTFRA